MDYFIFGCHLVFTYILSSFIIFLLVSELIDVNDKNARIYFGATCGLGPLVISWILACLLSIFPGYPKLFYLIGVNLFFIVFAILGRKQVAILFRAIHEQYLQFKKLNKCLLLSILLLFFCILILKLFNPNFNSDPLDYMHMAEVIAKDRNLDLYPMITANSYRSMIASWTHPVGYIGIYIWTYLGSPFSNLDFSLEITSFYYTVCIFLFYINLVSKEDINTGLLGFLFLITTPLFYYQVYQASIDPIRFYTFFVALSFISEILTIEQLKKAKILNYLFLGFLLAMSCFSHSFGILSLPIAGFIYFVLSTTPFYSKARNIFIFLAIPVMIISPRLWVNFKTFHSIIVDTSPVWNIPSLDYDNTLNIIRGLGTPFERVFYGVFKGFTNITIFGFAYWMLLLGIFLLRSDFKKFIKNINQIHSSNSFYILISSMVIILFYSMVFLSLFLNINVFIKNDRYILSIQPFIALLASYFVNKVFHLYMSKGINVS